MQKVLLIACTCPEPSTPGLGITSIATWLTQNQVEVMIFDDSLYMLSIADDKTDPRELMLSVQKTDMTELYVLPHEKRIDDLISLVDDFNPDLIGISITEATFKNALEYLKAIKERWPTIPNIVGGAFAILAPELVLSYPCVDMVALGEGEETLLEYLKLKAASENPLLTHGIMYKKSDGSVAKTPLHPLIDINQIEPLKYELYPEKRLYRPISGAVRKMLPLEVSRGCVYNCTFCASPAFKATFSSVGNWTRFKSVERIREDIEYYIKTINPEYFFIISETFLAMTPNYFEDFINMYKNYAIPFWMNTRPETIKEEYIAKLKTVGLERMSVGVECGNEGYRNTKMNRKYSNQLLKEVFDVLNRYEIKVTANIMIGLPGETRAMMDESVRLIKTLKPTSVGLAIFQPYKGTEMYQSLLESNNYDRNNILDTTCYFPNYKHDNLKDHEILNYLYTFNLRVMLPESEWSVCDAIDLSNESGWHNLRELLAKYEPINHV